MGPRTRPPPPRFEGKKRKRSNVRVMVGMWIIQARDFTNFGYPCWDGIKDTFRIL